MRASRSAASATVRPEGGNGRPMRPPVVIVSNRGPLSFRSATTARLVGRARRRRARVRARPRSSPAPTPPGSPPPCPTATARPPPQGVVEAEGFRVRLLDARPRRPTALAYDVVVQRHALVRPPRPLRPAPARPRASTSAGGRPWEAYRAGQPALRRGRGRARPAGRRRARAGLPPVPAGAARCASARPDLRLVHFSPHAVRRARLAAGAARRRRPRAARGHGRPPRLRLPHRPVGRRPSTACCEQSRASPRRRSCRRSAPDPDDIARRRRRASLRRARSPSSTSASATGR